MITMVFRFLALFLIVSALMLLGADAVGTLEAGGQVQLRSLGAVMALFAPGVGQDGGGPLALVLGFPGWAVIGIAGLALAFLFRHRGADDEFGR